MIKVKFVQGGYVAPGTVVGLNFAQADARGHMLAPQKGRHKDAKDERRLPFQALEALFFKAGEEIGVEGAIDRHLQTALGMSDEQVVEAGAAKPGLVDKVTARGKRKAKAKPADAAIDAAQAAVDAAKVKLDSAPEAERAAAQAALDDAMGKLAALQGRG